MSKEKRRIYVDCTETHKMKLNTGIQRVVRKIAQHKPIIQEIQIIPVYFDGFGFLPIELNELIPPKSQLITISRNLIVNGPLYPLAKFLFKNLYTLKSLFFFLKKRKNYVLPKEEEIFLAADIIRSTKLVNYLQKLKKNNVQVHQIVFDILPITHPVYFSKSNVGEFKKISSQWASYSTKIFAISQKVAKEVSEKFNISNVDFFHLGSDFILKEQKRPIKPTLFKSKEYFLSVGTIEPRKNHKHILKTFKKMWNEGVNEKLVFVGRMGWNCKEILKEIKEIKGLYPENFLWLSNLNDEYLEAYYKNAKAVICASVDEGFGLPLVEALSREKNVLCSDIEVFREIGTKYCSYFNFAHEGKGSLHELLIKKNYHKDISDFKWLTWKKAIDILFYKMLRTDL